MKTILVTGRHGQVGFELQRSLAVLGKVVAVDREECDLTDAVAVRALLDRVQPDIIVNPAAHTAVDKAESEPALAQLINADAPQVLAEWARAHQALLVHYSTDYVFDGSQPGWYTEADRPNPQSVYGKTKLAGEDAIRASGCRHLIFRTSWVFGAHGGNFAKTILRLGREREELKIVADQRGAPTGAMLLADVTAQVLAQYLHRNAPADFPFGLYHLVAAGSTSWYEYAQAVVTAAQARGAVLKLSVDAIQPIPTSAYPLPAPRPANSCLSTDKLRSTFGLALPDWQQGLAHVMQLIC
ncbi:dTDP-4-dehydrorhamnose reductase [Andreprevotia lacus DSM 23236]|uniref:dTDP-4-dehydrorhamnose reductase n=1 Tax=Andreprevotia lacus DSM 23236 TaxID=1121001 RepID=A0A1W1Y194_9NEIS|nr:dTDP-4-dehydrorhamnose reductase [Andreprevotia lacus]SMC29959.1 dTDP-4-dehydrorhamnose reductase [Andreprevotia lacus DSM 23236]